MIREGITQEMNIVASNLTSEDMPIFPLATAEEIQGVGTKLESASEIWNPAILHSWLSRLPENI